MIKGFIFDLDGVIIDTAENHYLAWKKMADQVEWNFDRELNDQLRGISRMDSIQIIANHNKAKVDTSKLEDLATTKNTFYLESLEEITSEDFLPGAQELLTHIRQEGFGVALGSASKNASKVLDQLKAKHYFDIIGDGNSVAKSKPEPDIFLYGADKLGCQPDECVVFEDAKKGVDAAKTGGFHSVGIGPKSRVGHADLRFDSMEDATLFAVKSHFNTLF